MNRKKDFAARQLARAADQYCVTLIQLFSARTLFFTLGIYMSNKKLQHAKADFKNLSPDFKKRYLEEFRGNIFLPEFYEEQLCFLQNYFKMHGVYIGKTIDHCDALIRLIFQNIKNDKILQINSNKTTEQHKKNITYINNFMKEIKTLDILIGNFSSENKKVTDEEIENAMQLIEDVKKTINDSPLGRTGFFENDQFYILILYGYSATAFFNAYLAIISLMNGHIKRAEKCLSEANSLKLLPDNREDFKKWKKVLGEPGVNKNSQEVKNETAELNQPVIHNKKKKSLFIHKDCEDHFRAVMTVKNDLPLIEFYLNIKIKSCGHEEVKESAYIAGRPGVDDIWWTHDFLFSDEECLIKNIYPLENLTSKRALKQSVHVLMPPEEEKNASLLPSPSIAQAMPGDGQLQRIINANKSKLLYHAIVGILFSYAMQSNKPRPYYILFLNLIKSLPDNIKKELWIFYFDMLAAIYDCCKALQQWKDAKTINALMVEKKEMLKMGMILYNMIRAERLPDLFDDICSQFNDICSQNHHDMDENTANDFVDAIRTRDTNTHEKPLNDKKNDKILEKAYDFSSRKKGTALYHLALRCTKQENYNEAFSFIQQAAEPTCLHDENSEKTFLSITYFLRLENKHEEALKFFFAYDKESFKRYPDALISMILYIIQTNDMAYLTEEKVPSDDNGNEFSCWLHQFYKCHFLENKKNWPELAVIFLLKNEVNSAKGLINRADFSGPLKDEIDGYVKCLEYLNSSVEGNKKWAEGYIATLLEKINTSIENQRTTTNFLHEYLYLRYRKKDNAENFQTSYAWFVKKWNDCEKVMESLLDRDSKLQIYDNMNKKLSSLENENLSGNSVIQQIESKTDILESGPMAATVSSKVNNIKIPYVSEENAGGENHTEETKASLHNLSLLDENQSVTETGTNKKTILNQSIEPIYAAIPVEEEKTAMPAEEELILELKKKLMAEEKRFFENIYTEQMQCNPALLNNSDNTLILYENLIKRLQNNEEKDSAGIEVVSSVLKEFCNLLQCANTKSVIDTLNELKKLWVNLTNVAESVHSREIKKIFLLTEIDICLLPLYHFVSLLNSSHDQGKQTEILNDWCKAMGIVDDRSWLKVAEALEKVYGDHCLTLSKKLFSCCPETRAYCYIIRKGIQAVYQAVPRPSNDEELNKFIEILIKLARTDKNSTVLELIALRKNKLDYGSHSDVTHLKQCEFAIKYIGEKFNSWTFLFPTITLAENCKQYAEKEVVRIYRSRSISSPPQLERNRLTLFKAVAPFSKDPEIEEKQHDYEQKGESFRPDMEKMNILSKEEKQDKIKAVADNAPSFTIEQMKKIYHIMAALPEVLPEPPQKETDSSASRLIGFCKALKIKMETFFSKNEWDPSRPKKPQHHCEIRFGKKLISEADGTTQAIARTLASRKIIEKFNQQGNDFLKQHIYKFLELSPDLSLPLLIFNDNLFITEMEKKNIYKVMEKLCLLLLVNNSDTLDTIFKEHLEIEVIYTSIKKNKCHHVNVYFKDDNKLILISEGEDSSYSKAEKQTDKNILLRLQDPKDKLLEECMKYHRSRSNISLLPSTETLPSFSSPDERKIADDLSFVPNQKIVSLHGNSLWKNTKETPIGNDTREHTARRKFC